MKNFRKSKKALSPVVASIILIAVTVAVSIAVAAWMGALTIGFMGTEELKITNAAFTDNTSEPDYIDLTVRNQGTTAVTISTASVNGANMAFNQTAAIPANTVAVVRLSYTTDLVDGNSYELKLTSTKGNTYSYRANAPS